MASGALAKDSVEFIKLSLDKSKVAFTNDPEFLSFLTDVENNGFTPYQAGLVTTMYLNKLFTGTTTGIFRGLINHGWLMFQDFPIAITEANLNGLKGCIQNRIQDCCEYRRNVANKGEVGPKEKVHVSTVDKLEDRQVTLSYFTKLGPVAEGFPGYSYVENGQNYVLGPSCAVKFPNPETVTVEEKDKNGMDGFNTGKMHVKYGGTRVLESRSVLINKAAFVAHTPAKIPNVLPMIFEEHIPIAQNHMELISTKKNKSTICQTEGLFKIPKDFLQDVVREWKNNIFPAIEGAITRNWTKNSKVRKAGARTAEQVAVEQWLGYCRRDKKTKNLEAASRKVPVASGGSSVARQTGQNTQGRRSKRSGGDQKRPHVTFWAVKSKMQQLRSGEEAGVQMTAKKINDKVNAVISDLSQLKSQMDGTDQVAIGQMIAKMRNNKNEWLTEEDLGHLQTIVMHSTLFATRLGLETPYNTLAVMCMPAFPKLFNGSVKYQRQLTFIAFQDAIVERMAGMYIQDSVRCSTSLSMTKRFGAAQLPVRPSATCINRVCGLPPHFIHEAFPNWSFSTGSYSLKGALSPGSVTRMVKFPSRVKIPRRFPVAGKTDEARVQLPVNFASSSYGSSGQKKVNPILIERETRGEMTLKALAEGYQQKKFVKGRGQYMVFDEEGNKTIENIVPDHDVAAHSEGNFIRVTDSITSDGSGQLYYDLDGTLKLEALDTILEGQDLVTGRLSAHEASNAGRDLLNRLYFRVCSVKFPPNMDQADALMEKYYGRDVDLDQEDDYRFGAVMPLATVNAMMTKDDWSKIAKQVESSNVSTNKNAEALDYVKSIKADNLTQYIRDNGYNQGVERKTKTVAWSQKRKIGGNESGMETDEDDRQPKGGPTKSARPSDPTPGSQLPVTSGASPIVNVTPGLTPGQSNLDFWLKQQQETQSRLNAEMQKQAEFERTHREQYQPGRMDTS